MVHRCAGCGHLEIEHQHYRGGSDCSYIGPSGVQCLCVRFAHPVIAWLYDQWDRLLTRFGR